MKKILKKMWGIGLVVVLLTSLLVSALPAAAGNLEFGEEALPGGAFTTLQLAPGTNVLDFAVAGDGLTIYAVSGATIYKSINAGATWMNIAALGLPVGITTADRVAVSPDDPNLVVVADITGPPGAVVSTSGGLIFSNLNLAVGTTLVAAYDVSISPAVGAVHYIAIPGQGTAGETDDEELWFFDLGSTLPLWRDAVSGFAAFVGGVNRPADEVDSMRSVAFSPYFASDFTALAVSEQIGTGAGTGFVRVHELSFNTHTWDTFSAGYPMVVENPAGAVLTVQDAQIITAPDYLGYEEAQRIAFVALAATDAGGVGAGGFYRLIDDVVYQYNAAAYDARSVAYDGTNLVAGRYDTNDVYRCADPLSLFPTVLPARTDKKVGLVDGVANDSVVVSFAGGNVVAAKSGTNSCFSVSRDLGLTFNDISLIDLTKTGIDDFAVSADGASRYVVVADAGVATSVFRLKNGAWERVLIRAGTAGYIIRIAPDNFDAVYLVDTAATGILYSTDAGQARWYVRATPGAVADFVVETKDVIYAATAAGVYKSINAGFTWGFPTAPVMFAAFNNLRLLSAGNLIGGSAAGNVAYSTDGAATWVDIFTALPVGITVATANGLAAGNNIYAVTAFNANVYRWTIGTNVVLWDNMAIPAASATFLSQDIELANGVLYRTGTTGAASEITRTLGPDGFAIFTVWNRVVATDALTAAALILNGTAPNNTNVSASNQLWFVDTTGTDLLYSYTDTFAPASAAPALSSPADATLIPVNNITGTANGVTFMWGWVPGAFSYEISVALDSGFDQVVAAASAAGLGMPFNVCAPGIFNPGTKYYWRARADTPVLSAWSETRTLTIQPGQALVAILGSPENGTVVNNLSPGFSWTPIAGATMYKFELSANAAFVSTVYDAEVSTAGAQLPSVMTLERGKQYFWRVKAITPVEGEWSTVANFVVAEEEPAPAPPVVIEQTPAPVINIPAAPPAQNIVIPAPEPDKVISPAYIWAIIIIGAVLVIAVIVLIVRTRRSV